MRLPDAQVYGLGMYKSKLEVLEDLLQRPQYAGHTLHFVEDRYPTLQSVAPHLEGHGVRLYLATWGYNTEAVREAAAEAGFVRLIGLQQFCALLKGDAAAEGSGATGCSD